MRVHLLHFLHYFSLLPPHLPAQKSARASNAGAPNIRHARLALRLEPCMARTQDVGQRGRTTIDVVLLLFCIISLSSIPSSGTEKRQSFKCSRAKHTPRAALPCGLSRALQCPTCGPSSRHERAILRVRFIALSALFLFLHPILPAQKKHRGFKCGRSKHAHSGLPCGLNLARHGRRTSVNADGRP